MFLSCMLFNLCRYVKIKIPIDINLIKQVFKKIA